MTDNVNLPATGTSVATEEIGGVHYQKIKVGFGDTGSFSEVNNTNPLPITSAKPATSTITRVTASTTDALILAANANRKGAIIENNATGFLYILFGTGTTSATNRTIKLGQDDSVVLGNGDYTGTIRGIWAIGATGNANITELS